MKKIIILFLVSAFLFGASACSQSVPSTPDQSESILPTGKDTSFDPYATENDYDPSPSFFEKQSDTDYGTLLTDVEYDSTTAEDKKRVNILLPPDYDENGAYPVLYMIHGWGGDYTAHLSEDSYLRLLYGNLYRDGLCEPMIIKSFDDGSNEADS